MKNIIFKSLIVVLFPLFAYTQITYESAFPNIDFSFPVEIQSAPDGTDRMFVLEQDGKIKVFPRNPTVNSSGVSTFLDISDRVSFINGQEIGLLGLAFHPQYSNNGYFYVYYTTDSDVSGVDVKIVLSRFTVTNGNINLADVNSELIIFEFDKNQDNSNHNGGKIAFGTDNYLYISFGDGGGGNDPEKNSQNNNNVFGTMCRIDIDIDGSNPIETNPALPNGNYEIPCDNPFRDYNCSNILDPIAGLDEIFAYGIRNTWKFSIDNITGTIWGADVGQGRYEEINIIKKGYNYGWSRFEANDVVNSDVIISGATESPVFFYDRSQDDRSITGGYVYRGSEITSLNPDISSKYIFGDFASGRVWALNYNPTTGDSSSTLLFKTNGQTISSFGLDKNGELYFSDYGSNSKIYKLVDGTSSSSATTVNGIGQWSALEEGINGIVNAVYGDTNGNVCFGGDFSKAGNSNINDIAIWNETLGWETLGSGTNGSVNAIKIASNGNIYIGGAFSEVNGVSSQNIAVYNGSSWNALASGLDGPVAALEIDSNGNLYAGGAFETVNGMLARNIAMWNGVSWSLLTDATNASSGTNNEIRALDIDSDDVLYVGGNFDEAGGNTANRIATWNGVNWATLGSGTSGFVEAIAVTSSDVFVGGNFALAGGVTVNRVAKWNKLSSTWSPLGNGVSNLVNSLIHDGTNLYVGGSFNNSNIDATNSIIVNSVAKWNETDGWKALGTNTNVGVDIKINTMTFSKDSDGVDKIFLGGNFNNSGGINTSNVSKWLSEDLLSINEPHNKTIFYIYPNPTDGIVNLSSEKEWTIFNTLGKKLKTGKGKTLSITTYPPGLYFLKIKGDSTLKIIKK